MGRGKKQALCFSTAMTNIGIVSINTSGPYCSGPWLGGSRLVDCLMSFRTGPRCVARSSRSVMLSIVALSMTPVSEQTDLSYTPPNTPTPVLIGASNLDSPPLDGGRHKDMKRQLVTELLDDSGLQEQCDLSHDYLLLISRL